jgi:protein-tyrosine phosphatase
MSGGPFALTAPYGAAARGAPAKGRQRRWTNVQSWIAPDGWRSRGASSFRYPSTVTVSPAHPERHLKLPGTRNLRDVGGYPAVDGRVTRWRTLLRTDALDRLPRRSQATLLDLGLRTVIDLRWPHELDEAPSVFRRSPHVTYRSIPLLEDDPTPYAGLAGTYRHMLDARAPQLVEVVRALLEPDGLPAVIGCAAGKDRTGVAVALILAAVGVPPDVVVEDYALSAVVYRAPVDDRFLVDWRAEPVEVECPPEYMLGALEHLERRHGGAGALLRRTGLTEREVDALVERLTEPAPG